MRLLPILLFAVLSASARPSLPIVFEPNRGQAGVDTEFLARAPGFMLSLHSGNAVFLSRNSRITATLTGGRPAQPEPEEKHAATITYLVGRQANWRRGIPTFSRVRYRGVYPGVDMVYYGREGSLEYDFIVAPGADPRQIRMRFEGASRLSLDAAGDLLIDTPSGPMRQHRPAIYQEVAGVRRAVAGGYILNGDTVRFRAAAYDRSRPLVIDPDLTWTVFTGDATTTLSDDPRAIAADSAGNVYAAGSSYNGYNFDTLIVKFDSSGNMVKIVSVGGDDGDDDAYGITVDSTGAIYVVGQTSSFDWQISTTYAGDNGDSYFAKIDSGMNNYVYAGYYGGEGDEIAFSCAVDSSNNLYIGGATISTQFPVTSNAAQGSSGGGIDGFLLKLDPAGNQLYSTYLGGNGDDWVYSIALDASGNWFATGQTNSTNLAVTGGVFQQSPGGGEDALVARYTQSGALTWLSYYGGSSDDEANAIAVDPTGAPVITGGTSSTNLPTVEPYQASSAGGARDMFVARIAPDGSKLAWSTYLGGSNDDLGNAIATDLGGNVYIGGSSNSTNFPSSFGWQPSLKGSVDGTVTGLSADGKTLLFSSFEGGTSNDFVEAVAVNCKAGLVFSGSSASSDFPASIAPPNLSYSGGATSGFVGRVEAGSISAAIAEGGIVNAATSSSSPVSPGSLISLYGSGLAGVTGSAPSTPLPTTFNNVTVTVNGANVPLVYVSPSQINFQLPYETATGTATATVNSGCGSSNAVSFPVVAAAPYIFLGGNGDAIVQNQDYSINSANNPAAQGEIVTVYLTGIGPLDSQVATGAAAPTDRLLEARLSKKAAIGGMDSPIQFLGLTPQFVGLGQANLQIPNLPPGQYPVVITVNGVDSNGPPVYVK